MFRALRNPAIQPNLLAPELLQTLKGANRFAANGQSAQAAPLFVQAAELMEATQLGDPPNRLA